MGACTFAQGMQQKDAKTFEMTRDKILAHLGEETEQASEEELEQEREAPSGTVGPVMDFDEGPGADSVGSVMDFAGGGPDRSVGLCSRCSRPLGAISSRAWCPDCNGPVDVKFAPAPLLCGADPRNSGTCEDCGTPLDVASSRGWCPSCNRAVGVIH